MRRLLMAGAVLAMTHGAAMAAEVAFDKPLFLTVNGDLCPTITGVVSENVDELLFMHRHPKDFGCLTPRRTKTDAIIPIVRVVGATVREVHPPSATGTPLRYFLLQVVIPKPDGSDSDPVWVDGYNLEN